VIPDESKYRELVTLLGAVRDGNATAEQRLRTNDLLGQYPELQQYYVEFMLISVELHGCRRLSPQEHADLLTEQIIGSADKSADVLSPADEARREQIRAKAQRQLEAFLAEQEALRRQQAALQRHENRRSFRELCSLAMGRFEQVGIWTLRMTKRLAAVTAVVLICLAITLPMLNRRVVAVLGEETDARWLHPPEDANLHPGPMVLEEGYAQITFKQGTQIILQAPCTFDLCSKNRMVLERGMVTANVPSQAHGFAVQTPRAQVTDFGTEFGLQVKDQHESEVHVFAGRVRLETASRARQPSQKRDITQGKAAVITKSGELNISSLGARPNLFVRNIPGPSTFGIPNKRMDVADIVGGGSGFGTGRRYAGIDPVTGLTVSTYRSEKRTGEKKYVEVPSLPFVDGVFTPLAQGGLMPISTAGHHFDFPPGGGDWYVEIAHGGKPDPQAFLTLDGQTYGTTDRPALLMHANVGITFNLDAIRESLTGSRIKRFTSVCGISNHVQKTKTPDAIIYVLVDGQVRFYRKIELPTDLAVNIRVDLREDERFLTLVCMAGTANYGDWTFFGIPALELEGER